MPNNTNHYSYDEPAHRVTRPEGTVSSSDQNPVCRPSTACRARTAYRPGTASGNAAGSTARQSRQIPSDRTVPPTGQQRAVPGQAARASGAAYPGRTTGSSANGTRQAASASDQSPQTAPRRPSTAGTTGTTPRPAAANRNAAGYTGYRTVSSTARTPGTQATRSPQGRQASGTELRTTQQRTTQQRSSLKEKSWMPLIIFLALTAAILIGICAAVALHTSRHPGSEETSSIGTTLPPETTKAPETTDPAETTAPETTQEPETTAQPVEEPEVPQIEFITDLSAFEAYMNPEDRDAYLKLINVDSPLASDYVPEGMIPVVDTRKDGRATQYMLETPEKAMEAMLAESRACGCQNITVTSAYRSYSYQQQLFTQRVNQYLNGRTQEEAYAIAATIVAVPGTSEHQSGLCADIHNISTGADVSFGDTAEGKWLAENCWKFGYILRYPADKTEETKISYEPWHFRFVGRYHAYQMWKDGICFEEYTARLAQNN